MQIEQDFFIRLEDTGKDFQLTNKGFLAILSNLACLHLIRAGQGLIDREKCGLSWMVVGWRLRVAHRPLLCETVRGLTWASGCGRLQAARDFILYDQQGRTLAKATSRWLVLNGDNTRVLRMTPEIVEPYNPEPDRQNFPGFVFPREMPAFQPERIVSAQVSKAMIDCNDHVHNTSYMDLFNEALPEDEDIDRFNDLTLVYRREIRPQQHITAVFGRTGEERVVALKETDTDQVHAFLLLK